MCFKLKKYHSFLLTQLKQTNGRRKIGSAYDMMIIKQKRTTPLLFFLILTVISLVRFVRISILTSFFSCCNNYGSTSITSPAITTKEFEYLSTIVARRAPCNLLVFGFNPQYLLLSSTNKGGNTIFVVDKKDSIEAGIKKTITQTSQIYHVGYHIPAMDAYKVLREARENPECTRVGRLEQSTCPLVLKGVPVEIREQKWDVVVVDGPGDKPKTLGRMETIYMAAVIAREREEGTTIVVVHNIDRIIERWFSWEFLCDENRVSTKERFWAFQIKGGHNNSTGFCKDGPSITSV